MNPPCLSKFSNPVLKHCSAPQVPLRDIPCEDQGCKQTIVDPDDPKNITLVDVCCTDLRHFNYIRDADLNESTVPFLGTRYYWGGGYVVDLVNQTQAAYGKLASLFQLVVVMGCSPSRP